MYKLNASVHYDFLAEAFRLDTGYMAPGKDAAPGSYPASYEERAEAWKKWKLKNARIIRCFEMSAAKMFGDQD